jgi:hypothetical protein
VRDNALQCLIASIGRALLTNIARSPNETREFRDLEQTYTTLAENEEWMAAHIDTTIQRRKNYDSRTALAEEKEQILKCCVSLLNSNALKKNQVNQDFKMAHGGTLPNCSATPRRAFSRIANDCLYKGSASLYQLFDCVATPG